MFFISLLNVEYFCMSVRAQDAPLCGLWEGLRRLMTLRHFSIYISSWVIIAVEMKFGKHILPRTNATKTSSTPSYSQPPRNSG